MGRKGEPQGDLYAKGWEAGMEHALGIMMKQEDLEQAKVEVWKVTEKAKHQRRRTGSGDYGAVPR